MNGLTHTRTKQLNTHIGTSTEPFIASIVDRTNGTPDRISLIIIGVLPGSDSDGGARLAASGLVSVADAVVEVAVVDRGVDEVSCCVGGGGDGDGGGSCC
jgi:hypothetical protein